MSWAAEFFGEGGAVLVVGCLLGMALLMWLLLRLTGDPSVRVAGQPTHRVLAEQRPHGLTDADTRAGTRPRTAEQVPSGSSGSGSVAP